MESVNPRVITDGAVDWVKVYEVWALEGEQSDQKTAQLCGVSRRTIAWQRLNHHWKERFVSEHNADSELSAGIARISARDYAPRVMAELMDIMTAKAPLRDVRGNLVLGEDGAPIMAHRDAARDRVNAGKLLLLYSLEREGDLGHALDGGLPVAFRVKDGDGGRETEDGRAGDGGREIDIDAAVVAILDNNANSVNTRIKKGRRT